RSGGVSAIRAILVHARRRNWKFDHAGFRRDHYFSSHTRWQHFVGDDSGTEPGHGSRGDQRNFDYSRQLSARGRAVQWNLRPGRGHGELWDQLHAGPIGILPRHITSQLWNGKRNLSLIGN